MSEQPIEIAVDQEGPQQQVRFEGPCISCGKRATCYNATLYISSQGGWHAQLQHVNARMCAAGEYE